jgi:tRNA-methyltransferase O
MRMLQMPHTSTSSARTAHTCVVLAGLFSTRSPHRPNSIALSALRIVSVDPKALTVTVEGLDLLDGKRFCLRTHGCAHGVLAYLTGWYSRCC